MKNAEMKIEGVFPINDDWLIEIGTGQFVRPDALKEALERFLMLPLNRLDVDGRSERIEVTGGVVDAIDT